MLGANVGNENKQWAKQHCIKAMELEAAALDCSLPNFIELRRCGAPQWLSGPNNSRS